MNIILLDDVTNIPEDIFTFLNSFLFCCLDGFQSAVVYFSVQLSLHFGTFLCFIDVLMEFIQFLLSLVGIL